MNYPHKWIYEVTALPVWHGSYITEKYDVAFLKTGQMQRKELELDVYGITT